MCKQIKFLILLFNLLFITILTDNIISMQTELSDSAIDNCYILDLPEEMLLKIIKTVIKSGINNWNNIFRFADVKKEINKEINNIVLLCSRFYCYKPDIIKLIKVMTSKRFLNLQRRIKLKYKDLSTSDLNNKLYQILNIQESKKFLKEITKLVLAGADPNIKSSHGYTALMFTVLSNHEDIVSILLKLGADINMQSNCLSTALILAVRCEHVNMVKLLITSGAQVNMQSNCGSTALIYAVRVDNKDIVKLLLDSGADKNITDNNGRDALKWAMINNNKIIVDMLEDNLNIKTSASFKNNKAFTCILI